MAILDKRITELTAIPKPVPEDVIQIVDDVATTATNKKLGLGTFLRTYNRSGAEIAAIIVNDDIDFRFHHGEILRYGTNVIPGTTVMTTAAQNALNQAVESGGAPAYILAGTYLIDAKLTVVKSGASDDERIFIHGDGAKSILKSTVIGDSTLEINDGQFVTVGMLRFQGNNILGASGNGHAIAFRDTLPQSGTFFPQNCDIRGVSVDGFRGNDIENTDTTTGVVTVAAAVYMAAGVASYVDRLTASNCTTGIHFDECNNCHISRVVLSIMDNWGIELDLVADGCSVTASDIINCGVDGNGDATIFSGVLNFAGIFVSSPDKVFISGANKFKKGQAITAFNVENLDIGSNFFRADAPFVVSDSFVVQTRTVGSITIDDNEVLYLTGTGTNTANGFHIDSNGSFPCVTSVTNNRFNHAEFGGFDVKYEGSSASDSNFLINHIGNQHGSSREGRTDSICADCIVLDTLNAHGQISGNGFTTTGDGASAGGLITDCLDLSAIGSGPQLSRLRIFGNFDREFLTGATITNGIEIFQDDKPATFTAADTTPDISWKSTWHTDSGSLTITDFDGYPVNGRSITVISEGAVTFDVTSTALHGGTTNILTAAGDTTRWALDIDGFSWRFFGFMDDSVDNSISISQEVVTTTNIITAEENGKTFFLDAVGGFTSTLPAPVIGLKYKFIVSTAPTTAYIITTNSSANILFGTINEITATAGVSIQAQDTMNFVASTSLIGDSIEVECDGTNWHVRGFTQVDNGITVSVT